METTLPLPPGFNLSGYTIQSLKQTDSLCHVYMAVDANQVPYLIREFCPQGLAVRDPESGKLRYPEQTDIEGQIIPLKNNFEAQFRTGAQGKISDLGTLFFVYAAGAQRTGSSPLTRASSPLMKPSIPKASKKKSNTPTILLILILLCGVGYGFYHLKNHQQGGTGEQGLSNAEEGQEKGLDGRKEAGQGGGENAAKDASQHQQGKGVNSQKANINSPSEGEEDGDGNGVVSEDSQVKQGKGVNTGKSGVKGEKKGSEDGGAGEGVGENGVENGGTGGGVGDERGIGKNGKKNTSEDIDAQAGSKKFAHQNQANSNKPFKQTTNMADVNAYIKNYAKKLPLNQWKKQYAEMYTSWFGAGDDVAKGWITTFGPLGFRARGLDMTWPEAGFRQAFPKNLLDPTGEPAANIYIVTQVIEGSPSAGHLKEGDLVMGIDGQFFKTSLSLEVPYGPYQHQDRRGLDMHAGLLVDQAEGAGKITLNIIPAEDIEKIRDIPSLWKTVFRQERANKPVELSLPVEGGQQVRLQVDDGGNGNGCDGFEWSNLRLEGPKGTITFAERRPSQYSVGHGESRYDKEKGVWYAHATSSIVFDLPNGTWTLKGTGTPRNIASVGVTVSVGGASELPANVKKYVKNVTFDIPQLGTFAPGFPKKCAKSKAIVNMMSEWLAAQQNEDGSWDRPGGYCGNHFDTAWAGLALMATGDTKYDPVIKKAAHYIAFSGSQCWWAVPQATAGIFLCEYWLRYRDNSVLPAIRNGVQRMKNEALYGDYVTGHGIHPGYRGTGVSIGGSHMCLFLAMASKTPARVDDGVLEKMMDHAQELCPTGMGPYGRTTETFTFEPNRECGGTYSGRHGPYFMASLISGGPEIYTKNSRIMYNEGPIGGCDQGHSSESLSIMWAFPSYWRVNPTVYYKNMEAFRWKLTLMRPFDGGMVQNPNKLELMTADPVIGPYIRTGLWITALCAERQNLAITGKPEYQAKTFRKVPPIIDTESRFLRTYIRNWSLAAAALGSKAPASMKTTIRAMKNIPVEQGCRYKLMDIINEHALNTAKAIMALQGVDQLVKATCAEMVLGMDIRIFFDPKLQDNNPIGGEYALEVEVQQPLGGRALGLHKDKEQENKANAVYRYDFAGTVRFNGSNALTPAMEPISWTAKTRFNGQWNTYNYKKEFSGPNQQGPIHMTAKINWRVNDLDVEYERPIGVGAYEVGCAEKDRPVTNCNHLWVPGTLLRDHGNWGCSFILPDGTYISAASQGNQIKVYDETDKKNKKVWVTPNDTCLTKGSRCMFRISNDWRGLECRVGELRLLSSRTKEVTDYTLSTPDNDSIDLKKLHDHDATTIEELNASGREDTPLVLELHFKSPTSLRAVDIKIDKGFSRLVIEAHKNGKWIPLHWGTLGASTAGVSDAQKAMYANEPEVLRMLQLPGNGFIKYMRTFDPVSTNKLRIKLSQKDKKVRLAELHVYRADSNKSGATPKRFASR